MRRGKLVITQRMGHGGDCPETITVTKYTPSEDPKGLSSFFAMPPSEDPWAKDFPDRITRTFHFSRSGGGGSMSSTPTPTASIEDNTPAFFWSSGKYTISGAPQEGGLKASTLEKFGIKSSTPDGSPKTGTPPTTAVKNRSSVTSSPRTKKVTKTTSNNSPTTRASVRGKGKNTTTVPESTFIIQELEGSPNTRTKKFNKVSLTPKTKAKSKVNETQSKNNSEDYSALGLIRSTNADNKEAPKLRHSARFFRPKITPKNKARSSMRVSGKYGGDTSVKSKMAPDVATSKEVNKNVDEDKPGSFFKRKSSGNFSGFWSFRRGSNATSTSSKPVDEDTPKSPTRRKSSGGFSSWFRGGSNVTDEPETRDTGDEDNNAFASRRKSSSGFSNFFSFRRKSNASVIDDDKLSMRRSSAGRFSLRKSSTTTQDDDLGSRSAFIRSSLGFGGRWGRRKSSGTPFILKKETRDRMGKKTTTVETRTYVKDGKNFEETIETITTEDDGKIRTKKTISTREIDSLSIKTQKPFEKGQKSQIKSQGSSSSSSSSSPDLRKAKEKEGSRGLFKSKGSRAAVVASGDSSEEEDFIEDIVKTTNDYRKKHGVGKLRLNKEMSKKAMEVAKKLAKMDRLEHSDDKTLGENLFCMVSSNPKFHMSGKQVVDSWYSEVKNHVFGREPEGLMLKSGHFSQLVWKESKEIGVAKARNATGNKIYVVAKFDPKGNWMGQFATQVPPVGGFPKQGPMGKIFSRKKDSFSSAASSDEEDFNEDCLKAHNGYRKKHGAAPLRLNKDLNKYAKEWALKIAKQDRTEHRPNNDYGENIYGLWSSNPRHRIKGNEAVDAWYDEVNHYDFSEEPDSMDAGHFTQLVWKDTKEIGVGKARAKNGKIYVVVNYNPPGNIVGQFVEKVHAPK